MRQYCDRENFDIEMLTDLQVFSTPEYENLVFGLTSVCMYVCAPERLDELYSYSELRGEYEDPVLKK
jgi:hypothetical protein